MDFKEYFSTKNLLKTPRIGVHFEQKTTPDLLWCVSHVILDITKNDRNLIFSDKDIRLSPVFDSLMQDYFSKPPQIKAENEYNKVSSYQLGVLVYTGVLNQIGERPKKYKIKSMSVLEYIAINDLNASKFLVEYTEKFLHDNNLLEVFNNYKYNPTQENHLKAKETYWEWAKLNMAVRGNDRRHTYRVFNKIFNVFCYKNRIPGEDASIITPGPCPYSFLIYNRTNFRDENMPPGMTRQQYYEEVLLDIEHEGVVATLEKRAKDQLKLKYDNDSEIREREWGYAPNRAVEVHHIFPKHSYSQFSLSRENLIVLTPDQHRSFAHNGNYQTINPEFQIICLKKKLENIILSTEQGENFYDIKEFIKILNTGFNWTMEDISPIQLIQRRLAEI